MVRFKPGLNLLGTLWALQVVITTVGHPMNPSLPRNNVLPIKKLVPTARPPPPPCSVYMPFDIDLNGHSVSHSFEPKLLGLPGSATLTNEVKARGSGSLKLDAGGSLEIPFAFNGTRALSWCVYSHQGDNNDRTSVLLSKLDRTASNPVVFSIHNIITYLSVGLKYHGGLSATYNFPKPVGPENGGFVQLCLTHDGKSTKFYQDKELLLELPNADPFMRSKDPFVIGSPSVNAKTYIDELLMCQRALSPQEIAAHFQGQDEMAKIGLIPPLSHYYAISRLKTNHHLHCHSPSCWKDPTLHQLQ